ncbi:hypothetical protein [Capnocytophaga sp. oral taxon 878]|uniref:hypothetical protein n=1 Tax=Capnocytophaga sp. oral taxon 878 TaxID=1316596 RepID=UPI0013ECC94A|nr:hypothetical protein [Capnocytophaga sp. oral taxon 878]
MAKKQTKKSTQSHDSTYWKISIALSAINVLIMLFQINTTKNEPKTYHTRI